MEPNIELAKPRDFGEIISDTFGFIRQNFKGLLKSFFVFCGFFILAATVSISLLQFKSIEVARSVTAEGRISTTSFDSISEIWINGIVMIVFIIGSYTANLLSIICYVALYKQKGNVAPTTEEMWSYFKYYFFRMLVACILIWIMLAVGYMLCLIPGIWLFPIFGLIFPIMIIENASFSYAFSRAFKLISNNWWITAGTLFIVWLIAYVMLFVVSIPTSAISLTSTLLHPKVIQSVSVFQTIFSAFLQQMMQIILVIPTIGICLCYFNLIETKEGTSLLDRIGKFGGQQTQTDLPNEEY